MRINFLFPNISRKPSGGHKVVYEYCNRLAQDNHDVAIYYFPGELFTSYYIPEGMRVPLVKAFVKRFGSCPWFDLNTRIKTKVIDHAEEMRKADIVIATAVETVKPILDLDDNYGKKVYFIQGYENWNVSDEYVKSTYDLGFKNLVVSKWLKRIVDEHSSKQSILISNGIDARIFKTYPGCRKTHTIVFQYRKTPNKGCEYALRTIEILKTEYPDLSVNVISSDRDNHQLPTYCHYYYNQTPQQVAEINNRSEVFICSTIDEGFGLPGLEAMACGCAVASTDYTGVHEYAVDGYNALLSPVRDPQAMADNVSKLFEDDELREKIVKNGIETGKEKSIDKSYQKFKDVLEELVKE